MPFHRYRLFGRLLEADCTIPGLAPAAEATNASPDIRLNTRMAPPAPVPDASPWFTSPLDRDGNGLRIWRFESGRYRFQYTDGTVFDLFQNGKRITATWPSSLTLEDAISYLCGHIMGFILGHDGCFCLHAGTVVLADGAVGFMAASGGGKSTTIAGFARLGKTILSDDLLVATNDSHRLMVLPGYPRIKLWSSAALILGLNDPDLPRLSPTHPTWDKRYLDLSQKTDAFWADPTPLTAIYIGEPADPSLAEPEFMSLSKSEAMLALLSNRYRLPVVSQEEQQAEFEWAARIADQIPIRRIRFHREPGSLPLMCRAVESDVAQVLGRAA